MGGSGGLGLLGGLPRRAPPLPAHRDGRRGPARRSRVSWAAPAPRRRGAPGPRGLGQRRARSLATDGVLAIAADRPLGSGAVTLAGFDPTTPWLAESTPRSTCSGRRSFRRGGRPARRWSSATTGSSSRSWARCRPWRSRRSRACCSSCWATSCSSAPSTTSSCAAWIAASWHGSRCRSSWSGSRWPPTPWASSCGEPR